MSTSSALKDDFSAYSDEFSPDHDVWVRDDSGSSVIGLDADECLTLLRMAMKARARKRKAAAMKAALCNSKDELF